jgi:hypothetical protein
MLAALAPLQQVPQAVLLQVRGSAVVAAVVQRVWCVRAWRRSCSSRHTAGVVTYSRQLQHSRGRPATARSSKLASMLHSQQQQQRMVLGGGAHSAWTSSSRCTHQD